MSEKLSETGFGSFGDVNLPLVNSENFSDKYFFRPFFDSIFDSTEWRGSLHCGHGGLRRARPQPSHVETMRLRVPSVPSWPGGRAQGQFPLSLSFPPVPSCSAPPSPPSATLLTLVSLSLSPSPLTTTGQAFWAPCRSSPKRTQFAVHVHPARAG